MISFEIRRKRNQYTTTPPYNHDTHAVNIREIVRQNLERQAELNQQRMADGEKPLPWMPAGTPKPVEIGTPPLLPHSFDTSIGMGKHGYAKWLNEEVYPNFKQGTLCTLRETAYTVNTAPQLWFEVLEIQEIHYMANMDRETRQPKAIGLRTGKYSVPVWYPPAKLRPLWPTEIAALDKLRNQTRPEETGGPSPANDEGGGTPDNVIREERPEGGDI